MRKFRDAAGVEWRVSLTTRSAAVSREEYLPEAYRGGWLLFESDKEKRRLAPVPSDWESLSDEALAMLCNGASTQAARPRAKPQPAATTAAPKDERLRPELEHAERTLDETLDEVCESPAVSKLDTGELIRVEETLALAAEAAKEAVSLRRRMHVDRERDGNSRAAGGPGTDRPTREH